MKAPAGYLGAGVSYLGKHRCQLLTGQAPPVLEVVPDHFFGEPEGILELAQRAQLVFHDVGLSLGSQGGLDAHAHRRLRRLRGLCDVAKPALFSDHLAATRTSSGLELGHLFPIRYTRRTLRDFADGVRRVQDWLQVPVAIENLAAPFELPGSEMDEAQFLNELVDATGCSLLLDLTNLLYNARNQRRDARQLLLAYPLSHVRQVHLAGGELQAGLWVDSHSRPVEQASFDLLPTLRGRAPLRCIIVERDEHLPALAALLEEARRADASYRMAEDLTARAPL